MEVTEALRMFTAIENMFDGSQSSADRVQRLTKALIENPSEFLDTYLDTTNSDDPIRIKAEAMIRSGQITDETTFSQLRNMMREGHRPRT